MSQWYDVIILEKIISLSKSDRKQNVNETWTKLNLICWFPPIFLFDSIVTNVIFYVIMTSNLSFHDHLLVFFVPSKKC